MVLDQNVINNQTQKISYPRTKQSSNVDNNSKQYIRAASLAGTVLGISSAVASCYMIKKHSNPALSLKNLAYNEKDILLLGAGSVLGGLAGGLISDKNQSNQIPKLREASLQFFGNLACPLAVLTCANKLFDRPGLKSATITKIAVIISSLVLGMNIGNKIMNKVNNKIFNQEQNRKIHSSDYLVHTDDICIAASLLLKDSSALSKIVSRVLPFSFILSGTKTGTQESQII